MKYIIKKKSDLVSWNILEREFNINLEYDTRKLYNLCISISISKLFKKRKSVHAEWYSHTTYNILHLSWRTT